MSPIQLPENVAYIINCLQEAGFEAYAVGGCVRDCILGNEPADWDITTSALPEQVKSIFPRTIDTGIKHGTVTVMLHNDGYEVTTYRIDGDYHDGRHPDSVAFTACLEEDLKRRDFTINAFVYNNSDGIIDMFDGLTDLENGIIRCVGDPLERFSEDALRILRALRFAARFSFQIDAATLEAMKRLGHRLSLVSAERIQCELDKLLISDNPDYITLLNSLGLDHIILPELVRTAENNDFEALKASLLASEPNHCIRWAVLCHYLDCCPPEDSRTILKRLKFDNQTVDTVCLFVKNADRRLPDPQMINGSPEPYFMELRYLLHDIGPELIEDYLNFRMALSSAEALRFSSELDKNKYLDVLQYNLKKYKASFKQIIREGQCTTLKELAVNGRDLMSKGYAAGEQLGNLLEYLLDEVIKRPALNTPEALYRLAETWSFREK